jgi:hypothetical protein
LKNEGSIRHQKGHLEASDLLSSDPTKRINFVDPIFKEIQNERRLKVRNHHKMETIVPKEASWED